MGSICRWPRASSGPERRRTPGRRGRRAVVGYDDDGIYGHPDHVQVTRMARAAAAWPGVPTVYGATVDREYLHFVESHVVAEAGARRRPRPRALAHRRGHRRGRRRRRRAHRLADKRAAIAAHASQIPESASVLQLPDDHFADVYGWEWYVRWGAPGPLERWGGST